MFVPQDLVFAARAKLEAYKLQLTARELAILSCAVVELESKGYKPFEELLLVQVDTLLNSSKFV